jgi:hypothetical protein
MVPDLMMNRRGVKFIVECNEYWHSNRNCYDVRGESRRPLILWEALQIDSDTMPVVYIYFNLDNFNYGGMKVDISASVRYEKLAKLFDNYNARKPQRNAPFINLQVLSRQ